MASEANQYFIETQAVSARWRALVKRHVKPSGARQEDYATALRDEFVRGLTMILVVAGVSLPVNAVHQKVLAVFGDKVASIATQAMEIQRVTGEEIISTEFRVICPQCDDAFSNEFMENGDNGGARGKGSPGEEERLPIMCTTDLGLRRYAKQGKAKDKDDVEESVLLKANVLLPSLLQDFIGQPKAEGRRQKLTSCT